MGCATTTKEDRGSHKMGEHADIAQLLIFRQGEFFAAEFLMAVELQYLRRVHKQNSSLACQAACSRDCGTEAGHLFLI